MAETVVAGREEQDAPTRYDLKILNEEHEVVVANKVAWEREESRLVGGDAMLTELFRWKGEKDDYFNLRLRTATPVPLPFDHASTLAGHLGKASPMPNFGAMGQPRERKLFNPADASTGEQVFYNADGIGNDGAQMPAFFDGVQLRSIATGFRWLLVEMPDLATLRELRRAGGRAEDAALSTQDVQDGFRPYGVESPPATWYNYRVKNGVLMWAVARMPVAPPNDLERVTPQDGYYLLVRKGYPGLGSAFAEGGWWKLDGDKKLLAHGLWDDNRAGTKGQIPLFPFYGDRSKGSKGRPSIAQMLCMPLGQIAVDLMNAESEYRHNIRQACKGISYILGGDETTHEIITTQLEDGSIIVTVPAVMLADQKVAVPQIWNSSAGMVDSAIYNDLVQRKLDLAHEIIVKQITSGLDASGEKVKASFSESTEPLLSRLAANREGGINNFLYFTALRAGKNPDGYTVEPREHDLRDAVADADAMLDTLRRSMLRSATLSAKVVLASADKRGFLDNDKDNAKIRSELEQSAQAAADQQAQDEAALAEARRPARAGGTDAGTASDEAGNDQAA